MKVILLKDIKSLGRERQVVEASDGYARNFLFPQNMATPATPDAMRARREREEKAKREAHKELSVYGDLAAQLDGHEVVIKQKINEAGTFYGAVTGQHIADALKKDGFKQVDASMVGLAHPIKEPSEETVTVSLPHGFEAEIRVVAS